MSPSIDSTNTVSTTASNHPGNAAHDEGNAMQQLLEEIRQLRKEQGKFIEVMKEMLRVKEGEEKSEMLESDQPGKSRDPPVYSLYFWEGVLSTNESLNENFDGFMSWLRGSGSSPTSRTIAVERPSVQFSFEEGDQEKLWARALEGLSDDEFGEMKIALQKHWPKSIPTMGYFDGPRIVDGRKLHIRDKFCTFDYEDDPMFRVPQMRPMRRSRGPFETPPLTPGSEDFDRCGLLCVVEATWLNRSVALLGFDAAAFIFQILSATCSAHGQNVELCSHNFLARHATIWPANTPRFWSAYWSGTTFLEYHMQSFITGFENPHPGDNLKNNPFGIRCEREDASLSLLGKKLFSVTERRYSHSVTISPYGSHYGNFAIVTLVDSDPERVDSLKYAEKKGVYDVEHCPRLSGLVVFQHQLCTSMDSWEDDWTRMLLQIDAVLTVKVNDILDPDSRERHMYDDEKLQQSALYFSLLQLLRIFSESIERNVSDLENLVGKSQTNLKERAVWYYQRSDEINREIATITQNWDVVLYRHKKAADALLARILRKTDDIKSLQDGLFSALSVKEAIKSTDINHYLLIFTVVTILYLPPAFVATFYGMHLFDTGDEIGSTQRQFWTVFASVSGVTYLIAVVALLGVDQRRKLRGWITNWYRGPTASQDSDDAGIKRKSNASPRGHAPHEGSFSSMFCRQTGADEDVEAAKGPDKGKEKKTT